MDSRRQSIRRQRSSQLGRRRIRSNRELASAIILALLPIYNVLWDMMEEEYYSAFESGQPRGRQSRERSNDGSKLDPASRQTVRQNTQPKTQPEHPVKEGRLQKGTNQTPDSPLNLVRNTGTCSKRAPTASNGAKVEEKVNLNKKE